MRKQNSQSRGRCGLKAPLRGFIDGRGLCVSWAQVKREVDAALRHFWSQPHRRHLRPEPTTLRSHHDPLY